MNPNDVRPGLEIKTVFNLESTAGILVKPEYLEARRPDTEGTVKKYIPGHGGDVWWVEHKDGSIAAYAFTEFQPNPTAANMTASGPVTPMKPLRFK
jgi:hypothetical protein